MNIKVIPNQLKNLKQWVCWKKELNPQTKLPTKVPYKALTSGAQKAGSTNRSAWSDFNAAVDAWATNPMPFDGIGFVLAAKGNIVGIDIDHCVQKKVISKRAQQIINSLPPTYWEFSPSGEGLRGFVSGTLAFLEGRKKGDFEIYDKDRYLTITGDVFNDAPIAIEAQQAINKLHGQVFGVKTKTPIKNNESASEKKIDWEPVLEKAFKSRAGDKLRQMYEGNWQDLYSSQSEADLAMCSYLVYWFDRNTWAVNEAFIRSGLMRRKWNKVHSSNGLTYGQSTIKRACVQVCSEFDTVEKESINDVLAWVANEKSDTVILEKWGSKTVGMSEPEIEMTKAAVGKRTNQSIKVLTSSLTAFQKQEKLDKKKHRIDEKTKKRSKQGKIEIIYRNTAIGECVQQISKILAENKSSNIFRYAQNMVKICESAPTTVRMISDAKRDDCDTHAPCLIRALDVDSLRAEIEHVAILQKYDKEGLLQDIEIPTKVLTGVLNNINPQELPLIGIVEHPYINGDFQAITEPGYDTATGLFKQFSFSGAFDNMPDKVTQGQAERAYNYLVNNVFGEFPFKDKKDQVSAIACLLTGLQRRVLTDESGCPGYVFTAPTQATGKTTLAQVMSYCLYGGPVAASDYSDNNEEMGKHLLSVLLEGHSAILFDNIQEGSTIKANQLAKAITSSTYSQRRLGSNEIATVPSSVLWMFTGNNISVSSDYNTRFLFVHLDSGMRDPENRNFKSKDICRVCSQNRATILKACMVIIMNGKDYAPGLKDSRYPLGWDKFIRYPLYKITGCDIMEVFRENKEIDQELESQLDVFQSWYDYLGTEGTTSRGLLDMCQTGVAEDEAKQPALNKLITVLTEIYDRDKNLPTPKNLSRWLSKHKGRYFGPYRLINQMVTSGPNKNRLMWSVEYTDTE